MIDTSKLFALCPEVDAALIISQKNRRYFSGFNSSFGFMILTKTEKIFITDSRYGEMAIEAMGADFKVLVPVGTEMMNTVKNALNECGAKTIGYEENELTVAQFARYKSLFDGFTFVEMGGAITNLKKIKAPHELDSIAKAQAVTDKAFAKILTIIKPEMSEIDIAVELEYIIAKNGGEGLAFDTIVASGANTSKPHAHPTLKKIKSGDTITIDFGAKVNGYCSDMTRTFFVGKPTDKMKEIYQIVLKAQLNVLSNLKSGLSCREVDALARELITANGYGENFQHGLGHGLGVDIHEAPSAGPNSLEILEENMLLTVEPGIYISGLGGVRIEDLVIIKQDGLINLTTSPKEIIIL